MKLFCGKEALIQGTDLIKPLIYTPLGTIELSLVVSSECYLPTHCSQAQTWRIALPILLRLV